MSWRLLLFVEVLVGVALAGCAGEPAAHGPGPGMAEAGDPLHEVGEEFHRLEVEENLWLQLKYGVEINALPELGEAHAKERSRAARALLDRLAAVEPGGLEASELVMLESLRWDLETLATSARHYWLAFPVTPYAFNWLGVHNLFQSLEVGDPAAARRYLDLAAAYPGFLTAMLGKLEGQRERGIVLPRAAIESVLPTWRALVDSPETVFPCLAEAPENAGAGFEEELAELVEAEVLPAWRELVTYLEGDYLAAAPAEVGLSQYPGGDAYYDWLIRQSVTLEMPPEEIHRIGLDRLAASEERMRAIRQRLGFEGTADEFHRRLAAEPDLFAATPEEVGDRLRRHLDEIAPRMADFFARVPRAPWAVERLGADLEAGMTWGYYIEPSVAEPRGVYYYNGSSLGERSMIGAAALAYHEILPGHHLQVSLQTENQALPAWRRDAWHDAFGEGWAEYAAELAEEMGMYRDPYDLYGRLAEANVLSARLVVDTGMNRLGWSRARAADFMAEHTLLSRTEIDSEMLRYSTDIPAQALAYAMGARAIRGLRQRAEEELADRFDVRRFHAAVLDHGSMPLAVLERHVERFVERERDP